MSLYEGERVDSKDDVESCIVTCVKSKKYLGIPLRIIYHFSKLISNMLKTAIEIN